MKVNIKDSEIIDNLPGGVLIYRADKENEEILFVSSDSYTISVIKLYLCSNIYYNIY